METPTRIPGWSTAGPRSVGPAGPWDSAADLEIQTEGFGHKPKGKFGDKPKRSTVFKTLETRNLMWGFVPPNAKECEFFAHFTAMTTDSHNWIRVSF